MAAIIGNSVGRSGGVRIRSTNGIPVLEETYTYIVEAEYVEEPYLDIINATGLPVVNSSTASGGITVCTSKYAKRRPQQSLIYDVTAEFSSEIVEGSDGNQGDPYDPQVDPVTWVPLYETKFERLQEVVTKDQSGNSIANSKGEPFATGLTISRFIPIWEFYQFEAATLTDEDIIERNEVVNSGTFKGRGAKTLLCTVLSSVIGIYYGRRMRLTHYALRYNDRKWTHKRLDVGLNGESLDGAGAEQAAGTAPAVEEFDIFATDSLSFLRT